ncbi:MAG TPA: 2TM domain-containing protein [Chitinophagaceae bacterium]|nr:2TM domain-containing protein [Chitinophagaceae bacterium]
MQQYSNSNTPGKDPELWEIAKKRAGFRSHFATYLIMQPFFWLVWWFTGGDTGDDTGLPWAVWPTIGWGIGVFFHYLDAYVFHKDTSVQREYDKLVKERKEI